MSIWLISKIQIRHYGLFIYKISIGIKIEKILRKKIKLN